MYMYDVMYFQVGRYQWRDYYSKSIKRKDYIVLYLGFIHQKNKTVKSTKKNHSDRYRDGCNNIILVYFICVGPYLSA